MPNASRHEVPIPDEVKAACKKLISDTTAVLPEGWGCTVLMFTYERGQLMYVSTAHRGDMVRTMAEFVLRELQP